MMSINACKGFDYGSGFEHVDKRGSEMFLSDDQQLVTGGIAGGITDGTPIVFRCVFKPTPSNKHTLGHLIHTTNHSVSEPKRARMDACVAVRAVPVVEAMAALVIADLKEYNREV
jgi:chorismate synthase